MKTLIVEDDSFISYNLSEAMRNAGLAVDTADDGETAELLVETNEYDAIILDLGLPKKDGLTLLKSWRRNKLKTPILILTARSSWHEKVEGLNSGADDYLAKPFVTEEVLARVRALIRRSAGTASDTITIGNVTINTQKKQVTMGKIGKMGKMGKKNEKEISLTSHEYRVLEYLMTHSGRVVSKETLAEHIYELGTQSESNTIEVFVTRLRRKLDPKLISTVRGLGYRIDPK